MSYNAPRLLEVFGAGRHSAGITPGEAQALARRPEAIAERVYGLGNPSKARELGNTQSGDGFRYRGGGLMQTTGRANYRWLAFIGEPGDAEEHVGAVGGANLRGIVRMRGHPHPSRR
jgi:predicted chitinase